MDLWYTTFEYSQKSNLNVCIFNLSCRSIYVLLQAYYAIYILWYISKQSLHK